MPPIWLQAILWGLVAGSALLLGAAVGYFGRVSGHVTAWIMAFGCGVLISALSFDLMDEAYQLGGFAATAGGFLAGAVLFTAANLYLAHRGASHRKRSGHKQPSEQQHSGSGLAIAVGALLDGVPESIVIGVGLIEGGVVSVMIVAAVFLSNFPEGLSSAVGMRNAGRPLRYVFGLWGSIAAACSLAAFLGYVLFSRLPVEATATATAIAAGAILAMLADTMLPEAFDELHNLTGLITVLGFLVAFILTNLGG
jgi:zinc transporter, ZIP family